MRTLGLAAPERTRLADQIVDILLDAILDGRVPVGSLLPPERDLVVELGVNRTSIRHAIARLEQMGVLQPKQGRGTLVCDPAGSSDPTLVAHLMERDLRGVLRELLEVRTGLAGLIGRLTAERADEYDRGRLRERLAELDAATTPAERQRLEMAFFTAMVATSRNRPLAAMQQWVERAYGDAAGLFIGAFEDGEMLHRELAPVLEAVEAGDPEAAATATASYAESSGRRLFESAARARRARPVIGAGR